MSQPDLESIIYDYSELDTNLDAYVSSTVLFLNTESTYTFCSSDLSENEVSGHDNIETYSAVTNDTNNASHSSQQLRDNQNMPTDSADQQEEGDDHGSLNCDEHMSDIELTINCLMPPQCDSLCSSPFFHLKTKQPLAFSSRSKVINTSIKRKTIKGDVIKQQKIEINDIVFRVKKDALWKTLLRMLRKHYQDLFIEHGLGKGKDHWSHEKRVTQVLKFMKILGLLTKVNQNCGGISELDQKTQKILMGFILLLFTTKHKHPPAQLKQYVKALLPTYWLIFNNNNHKLLQQFFADSLLMMLWNKYPKIELIKYLEGLNKNEQKLMRKDFKKYNLDYPQTVE